MKGSHIFIPTRSHNSDIRAMPKHNSTICIDPQSYTIHQYQYNALAVQDLRGSVWLYCAITALLFDLPAEVTACTAMLVYTLFFSSPVKLQWVRSLPVSIDCSEPPSGVQYMTQSTFPLGSVGGSQFSSISVSNILVIDNCRGINGPEGKGLVRDVNILTLSWSSQQTSLMQCTSPLGSVASSD